MRLFDRAGLPSQTVIEMITPPAGRCGSLVLHHRPARRPGDFRRIRRYALLAHGLGLSKSGACSKPGGSAVGRCVIPISQMYHQFPTGHICGNDDVAENQPRFGSVLPEQSTDYRPFPGMSRAGKRPRSALPSKNPPFKSSGERSASRARPASIREDRRTPGNNPRSTGGVSNTPAR